MRVSSAPCEAGKKMVTEEIFVNFAALENLVKPDIGGKFCVGMLPDLILSDLPPLRYIELLSWGLVFYVVKVDIVFVGELQP
jgi:hypothetical protein